MNDDLHDWTLCRFGHRRFCENGYVKVQPDWPWSNRLTSTEGPCGCKCHDTDKAAA